MKRVYSIFVLAFIFSIIASCSSTPPAPKPSFTASITTEKNSGILDIKYEVYQEARMFSGEWGVLGTNFTFKNNTSNVAKVIWAESSISYNGGTYSPFIEGQKFIDLNTPMPPLMIPGNKTASKDVYSTDQVSYSSGWDVNKIYTNEITYIFSVTSGDIKDIYTVTLTKE
jgi:hypothetical protein